MRRLLRDAMPLRRGEWGLALFLYFLLTVMVGADWVGKLGADALFVKRYGIQNIPWMYVVTPIAMLAVSALIFFFIDRMRRRTMLLVYVAAVTLLSIGIQYAITTNAIGSVVQPISYIFAHGVKETIYILFWVYAGNLYDAEQSKRLFPFFAGSVLVGKILGGVVGAAIAPVIHAENFIGAQAVGFFVCFVALVLYRRLPEGRSGHVEDKHRPQGIRATIRESTDGYRAVTSDPLLRTFGVGVFFWYFLMQFANFLYLLGLDQSSAQPATGVGREDVFSQLYASVYTSSSLVALAIQSFITSGLLRRIGIAWMLFFLPLWFLGTYAAAAWWNLNLVTGVALQLGERIWIPALHRPASELVYSQVSAAIRPRARAFLSGGVNAFGNMAAAVALILGLQPYVRVGGLSNIETLLSAGTGVSLVFVYNAWHTRRLFGRRIARNLTSPDPDLRRNAADMLSSEGGAVPDDELRALGGRIPADVEHGVRLALTRKGILAVAADVTE